MLTLDDRLSPNSAEVAASVMDGEAVIINLSTGVYYSMDQVGGLIWAMIAEQHCLADIVSAIVQSYEVSTDQVRADLERLAAELLEENLVVVLKGEAPAAQPAQPEPLQKLPYDVPRLDAYRDMEDLLALDPPLPRLEDLRWPAPTEPASH
jgi:hypothetical protein